MYQILRSSYDAWRIASLDFLRRIARLVQEHTEDSVMRSPEALYLIDADALRRLVGEDAPDAVKEINLLKAIRQIVEQQAGEQPRVFSIGGRVEAIFLAFEERQITTQEALSQSVEGPA